MESCRRALLAHRESTSNSLLNVIAQKNKLKRLKKEYKSYYQDDKGMISSQDDSSYIISLFKGADASTDYFVDTFMKDSSPSDADNLLKQDRQRLLEYVGMTEEQRDSADINEHYKIYTR